MQQRRRTTKVLIGAGVGALLALVVAAGAWHFQGGRWFDVRTASMGTAAPVGTLLLTRPVDLADVRVGELITFHAPGSGMVYSHRVFARTATGLQTKGDVNPVKDAWTLHSGDLVGRVVWRAPALGWLMRALPALLLCGALIAMASSLVRRRRRGSIRILGISATVAALGYVLHPWVGLERIGSTQAREGLMIKVISTGLFPVRVSAVRGTDSDRLVNGQVADVHVPRMDAHHAYSLASGLSLTFWWWAGIVALCLAPLLWTMLVGLEPVAEEFLVEDAEVLGTDGEGAVGGPVPVAVGAVVAQPDQDVHDDWVPWSEEATRLGSVRGRT